MNAPVSSRCAGELARWARAELGAWWRRGPMPKTSVLLGLMMVGGVALRIQRLPVPFDFTFDEQQYVDAAHHYLLRIQNLATCHPPLSKLLLDVGMLLFGHNPIGWRFMALCFGIQSVFLAYWVASSLFEDRRAGWFAAAFVAADGFFIAYSRCALPDGIMATFILWALLAAVSARGWPGVLVSGVLVGIAASVKWSGLMVGLPACLAVLLFRRAPWYSLASFAVVPVVHWAVWVLGLRMMGHPSDLKSIVQVIQGFLNAHLSFPHNNPLSSSWYTWPVLYHPIVVKLSSYGLKSRYSSSMGNPLLWYTAELALLGLPLVGAVAATRARWRQRWSGWFDRQFTKALVILVVGWIAMLLPWIISHSRTFWYHYMPSWTFTLLLFSGLIARLERRSPRSVLAFVLVVLAVAVFYAPVWGEFPLTTAQANLRLIFKPWQP
ncbi:MAG: phospholipid carrier-dependent glycosyltransferase [Polyangiaceae bacterium]|nr:phospholipid carrier-dependent glycosyltransferase [Polyangiaceae bacterium]